MTTTKKQDELPNRSIVNQAIHWHWWTLFLMTLLIVWYVLFHQKVSVQILPELDILSINGNKIIVSKTCFEPRELMHCSGTDNYTWVEHESACEKAGFTVRRRIIILAECKVKSN